jgi:hypothetical protein
MAELESLSDIRDRFVTVVTWLKDSAETAANALRNTEQRTETTADKNEWTGDPFDLENLGKPFDRTEQNEDMHKVVTARDKLGVIGDLQLITLQGDYLATLERATRLRLSTRCRATAHAAARLRGHGHTGGLFNRGVIGQIARLSKLSKDIP